MRQIILFLSLISIIGCSSQPGMRSEDKPLYLSATAHNNFKAIWALKTARELQNMDRDKALNVLRSWTKDRYDMRSVIMCRMLFQGDGKPLRGQRTRNMVFLGATPLDQWPLEPITIFQNVPIAIAFLAPLYEGPISDPDSPHLLSTSCGAICEHPSDYLEYCIQNGVWVTRLYETKTTDQIQLVLKEFINTTNWQRKLSTSERDFIMAQAQECPTRPSSGLTEARRLR